MEKYYTNEILKNSLRKEKKNGNSLQEKQQHAQNKNLITIYVKSSYPFTIQKFLCLFSASHDILKTELLETMQLH